MKKLIILLISIALLNNVYGQTTIQAPNPNTTDTSLLGRLLAINLNSYKDKPVLSLLRILPKGFLRQTILGGDGSRRADCLYMPYYNNISIAIHVRNFKYLVPFNKESNWDLDLFKQEDISCVEVFSNGNCVSGCGSCYVN